MVDRVPNVSGDSRCVDATSVDLATDKFLSDRLGIHSVAVLFLRHEVDQLLIKTRSGVAMLPITSG